MECQVKKNEHFQHLLVFAFNQGSKATKAARDICAVYGEGAIAERTAHNWYAKFKSENFDFKDTPHSGRPVEFDEERLNQLLHENSRQTTRELAEKMECSQTAIEKHLHSMGKVQKYGAWVPLRTTKINEPQSPLVCLLVTAQLMDTCNDFFTELLLATKNGVKQDLYLRKTMLCVWWNWEGIIHYELLERNQTVNAELYAQHGDSREKT
ncbi:mariner Mos1 transposase isoform X3 [Octopus bimaculoides]|uniref:mariner Mos1 transposase isoform X3 n=1 Tax=Octopus bimaculoides TaxID=37653 RepID=UPI0022E4246A|nr:mariner Mos1 transposase isoform X3 [Octopus bimaculoides]